MNENYQSNDNRIKLKKIWNSITKLRHPNTKYGKSNSKY